MSEEILFYAFRYALPRSTKAVDVVVDYMLTNWDSLDETLRLMVIAEIRLATHTSLSLIHI